MPLSWCSAPPSSYVDEDAYERVAAGMLEDMAAAGALDGIYLDLHGAMVAAHHEDGEGELLRRIRALVGDALPIVASLDFHTNMTEAMVRHASAMVGYRTYPHVDMAATGSRAAELLDRLIREKRPLAKALPPDKFSHPAGLAMHDGRADQRKSSTCSTRSSEAPPPITRASSASPIRRAFRPPTSGNAARPWWSTATTRRRPTRQPTG